MASKTGPKVVGLDIGTTGIRAVELSRNRKTGEYSIKRAAVVDLPRGAVHNGTIEDGRTVTKALRKLWRKGHFSTRKVVMGLADTGVLTRQMELPWMQPADFKAALRYQVADALPVDLETVELDYHLLGEGVTDDERGQPTPVNRILIVAANREAVTTEANVLRKARLEPVSADSSAFALIRAVCGGRLPTTDETLAIADIGADQLTVIIHQAGQPRFIRTVGNLGGETAIMAVSERLNVDPERAEELIRVTGLNGPVPIVAPIAESTVFGGLTETSGPSLDPVSAATVDVLRPWATTIVDEIRNSLDYFQASDPTAPIRSLAVTGRTPLLEGMIDRIATQVPLPVRMVEPLVGLGASRSVQKHRPFDGGLAVAAGLAMG
jgi:type IV pilus assembly protein PilM